MPRRREKVYNEGLNDEVPNDVTTNLEYKYMVMHKINTEKHVVSKAINSFLNLVHPAEQF